MPTGTISITASIAGTSFIKSLSKTGDHPQSYEVPLPVATAVVSWVKTDADTGVATLGGGHGLGSGTYDCYWPTGYRYGLTGTVSSNELTLDLGAGDDFPATADPITGMSVCEQVEINTQIDGDTVQIIGIVAEYADTSETSHCSVDMQDSGSASIEAIDLIANEPWTWWIDSGTACPLTGNPIIDSFCSNSSITNIATLKILVLEDSTP